RPAVGPGRGRAHRADRARSPRGRAWSDRGPAPRHRLLGAARRFPRARLRRRGVRPAFPASRARAGGRQRPRGPPTLPGARALLRGQAGARLPDRRQARGAPRGGEPGPFTLRCGRLARQLLPLPLRPRRLLAGGQHPHRPPRSVHLHRAHRAARRAGREHPGLHRLRTALGRRPRDLPAPLLSPQPRQRGERRHPRGARARQSVPAWLLLSDPLAHGARTRPARRRASARGRRRGGGSAGPPGQQPLVPVRVHAADVSVAVGGGEPPARLALHLGQPSLVLSRGSPLMDGDPKGPAALVRRAAQNTVAGLFSAQARTHPERVAVVDGARTLTYRELDQRSRRAASMLAARGDRLALLAENRAEVLELFLAAARLGAIVACQNWRLKVPEIAHCVRLVAPKTAVVSPKHAALIGGLVDDAIVLGDDYERLLAGAPPEPPPVDVDPEDGLLILYTSGTTGLPKGALLSHRAEIVRNLAVLAEFGV